MTPPDRKEVLLDPPLFAEVARSVHGDYRARYGAGDVICFTERGTERELHVHLSSIQRAPAGGGQAACGLTVLPVDIRWQLLYVMLKEELPLFRHKIYHLMKDIEQVVGDQFLLEQQEDVG